MITVEPALFSNIIITVQRTSSLTGGSVSGLPNGIVIEGMKGTSSFGSDIAEAQKEYELGRIRSALDRVRQIETQFNGIAGRWNAQVGQVISSARQGRQQLSIQKLNEVKNAQTKMQQLAGPASKSFQDLVSALEHAVSMEGRDSEATSSDLGIDQVNPARGQSRNPVKGIAQQDESEVTADQPAHQRTTKINAPQEETPDLNLLGSYMTHYRFGEKLTIQKGPDNVARVVPRLEKGRFYFANGFDPPRVFRVRELQQGSVLLYDPMQGGEVLLESSELKVQLQHGIWSLAPK